MLSYPSGMSVSTRGLIMLADALRRRRAELRSRWRRLDAGQQALLVVAHLREGDTYAELACGFAIGTVARRKAYVVLDGTLLRIDRVGIAGGSDRLFYSGKHKQHGVDVQVLADPVAG